MFRERSSSSSSWTWIWIFLTFILKILLLHSCLPSFWISYCISDRPRTFSPLLRSRSRGKFWSNGKQETDSGFRILNFSVRSSERQEKSVIIFCKRIIIPQGLILSASSGSFNVIFESGNWNIFSQIQSMDMNTFKANLHPDFYWKRRSESGRSGWKGRWGTGWNYWNSIIHRLVHTW